MADPPPYPGMPRWAKAQGVLLLIFLLLILAMVAPMLLGLHGAHGPMSHGSARPSPPERPL